ncbi:hypothetical protein HY523_00685 [Candidatus Berkelbacteria bacterium]|nr:hypothetical protein [Candidatus Berkelbacteria bacterium]
MTCWLDFFLDGVAIIAQEAIETSKKINELKKEDDRIIQSLGKAAKSAAIVVENLYKLPITSVKKVEEWTTLSRPAANEVVKKLVTAGVLEQRDKAIEYGREFWHKRYLDLFLGTQEEQ